MPNGTYSLYIDHISGDSLLQIEGDWKSLKGEMESLGNLVKSQITKSKPTKFKPETTFTAYTWSKALTKAEISKLLVEILWIKENLKDGEISITISLTSSTQGRPDDLQFHDILTLETIYQTAYGPTYWLNLPGSSIWTQEVLMTDLYARATSKDKVIFGGVFSYSWQFISLTQWADRSKPSWWVTANATKLAQEAAEREAERVRKAAEAARKAAEEKAKARARGHHMMLNKPYTILGLAPTARDWQVEVVWKAMMLAVHPDKNNGADQKLLNDMTALFNMAHDKIKKDRGSNWNPRKPWLKEK
jgi:hypothetical protein